MNYRHAFHAGNFADLLKHSILLRLLADLAGRPGPVTVIDTHAGAGVYDLFGQDARRTGEADAGIGRLMTATDAPDAFAALKAAVSRMNQNGPLRFYPGSPRLVADALSPGDRYCGFELRPDDYAALRSALPRTPGVEVLQGDGWAQAMGRSVRSPAAMLALIDPPFEQGDDYRRAAQLVADLLTINPLATVAVWVPVKDLTTLDAFLIEIEDAADGRPILIAEVRLRPLSDPMRMNGCAMVVVNPTIGVLKPAEAAAVWLAGAIGEAGALGRVRVREVPVVR